MRAGQSGVANHGVFLHLFQAAGLAHSDAFVDVCQNRHHLFPGQVGAEVDRPLPLGESRPALPTAPQATGCAGTATEHDQIPHGPLAVLRTLGIEGSSHP